MRYDERYALTCYAFGPGEVFCVFERIVRIRWLWKTKFMNFTIFNMPDYWKADKDAQEYCEKYKVKYGFRRGNDPYENLF